MSQEQVEQSFLGVSYSTWITILSVIVIVTVAIVLERIVTLYLSRFAKRTNLKPSVTNNLVLTFRILVLIGAVLFLGRVGGLQTEWLLSFSAIGGAALGFASTKTIGNFVAGLFLLAARPFRVGDYVRIGVAEGIVQEITLNYTKILTMANNTIAISNLQILDRDVTNFYCESETSKNVYCYTFEINFDHNVSQEKIAQIFNKVFQRYFQKLPKEPNFVLNRSSAAERVYTVYFYVEDPQMIFTLKPQIADEILQLWDKERVKQKQAESAKPKE